MNGNTMRARGTAGVLVCVAALVLGTASANASVFNVNTTADPNPQGCPDPTGACSLREAITAAKANDTILVPAAAAHYTLARGPLVIGQAGLVIIGADARGTVIDGAGSTRVFDIDPGASPSISDLTVMNGNSNATAPVGQGGGILVQAGATLTLSNSTVANNIASGSATNGSGGGIYSAGTLEARGVTISGNVATSSPAVAIGVGGGIDNEGTLTLVNATVASNTAGGALVLGQGGGLVTGAGHSSTLTNATVTDNQTGLGGFGPNLFTSGSGSARLQNTIVAGGGGGLSAANCSGPTQSAGNNLEDLNTCGFGAGGDRPGTDPKLGALANNGGPTDTRALLSGSPAIDAGSNLGCPPTDQRGLPRPQGPRCDIGAYEVGVGSAAANPNQHNSLPLSSTVPLGSVISPAVLGRSFNLVPVRGTVTYRLPNGQRYSTLVSAVHVPLRTIVEASSGTARVISARNSAGLQQSADFYDGPFEVRQSLDARRAGAPRTGITDLFLRFGDFAGCDRVDRKQIEAVAARKKRRRLWGKGKGSYRTRGNYGSASVRGTWWFTKDVCDGTQFYVREGTVKVRDNTRRRTVTLRMGQSYFAQAPSDKVLPTRGSQ